MMRKSYAQGFTLVEMMIVIAVMAIILTIAVPSFNSLMDSTRVKRAADAANAFLINAKSEAIKRNATVRVVASESGGAWCLGMTTANTCDCFTAGACQINGADVTVSGTKFNNVVLNEPDNGHVFAFSPLRGTVTGQDTVELESDLGIKVNVAVSQLGRIRPCTPDGSAGGYPAC